MPRTLLALGLLGVAAILTACDPLTGASHDRADDELPRQSVGTEVVSIRQDSPGELRFTIRVPTGGPGCAGKPYAVVKSYDSTRVTVSTVVPSNRADYCDGTRVSHFTTPLDLQGRTLLVNDKSYAVSGTSRVEQCNALVGCNPPDDRCDPVWTRSVIPHFDLPPAKRTSVVSCRGRWLVLNVTATTRSGSVSRLRWFAELDPQRNWQVVATTPASGCVDVRLAVPSFPLSRCRNLRRP